MRGITDITRFQKFWNTKESKLLVGVLLITIVFIYLGYYNKLFRVLSIVGVVICIILLLVTYPKLCDTVKKK